MDDTTPVAAGLPVRHNNPMRGIRTIMAAVLLLAIAGTLGLRAIDDDGDAKPQRVIAYVNRNQIVMGTVESEDEDNLVIRTERGELETLLKGRINQVVKLVDPLPGQTGLVIMRDGEVREGIILADEFDHVMIQIEGIRARLKRENVSHVVLQPTFDQRYREYKAALQPGMFDAHLKLGRWLFEQRRYEMARAELQALLKQTEMLEARRLLTIVEAQLALLAQQPRELLADDPDAPAPDDEPVEEELPPRAGAVREQDLLPQQLVTKEDVNIIRVYELDFENLTRVSITPDTVRNLIEKYGTSDLIPANQTGRNAIFRAAADDPMQVVRLMFELRARDLYPQIQVNSEPHALNLFRQRVHDTWLMNNCATRACHGGPYAGSFFLHRRNYKDDRVRYTNLLILERLKLDEQWPLINYDDPERSLIIQYALPRDQSRKPHPKVTNWKPAFSPTSPRMKDDAIEWMKSMMVPRPAYPVEYEPPVLGLPKPKSDLNNPNADPARPPR